MTPEPHENPSPPPADFLSAIQKRLAEKGGKESWRSLDELANSPEFFKLAADEFPQQTRSAAFMNRRDFLKLMAASLGLAGLTACTPQPGTRIMPYIQAPPELVPGEPLFFASAFEMNGYARGVLVKSHMGRPIKIEGNPRHPASLGASDPFMQASILELYDPDRLQTVSFNGQIRTRGALHTELGAALSAQRARGGAGLRLLTETITSPSLAAQLEAFFEMYPSARWVQYDPVNADQAYAAAEQAFGEMVETHYNFEQARVILAIVADFLLSEPGSLRYIRDFTARRKIEAGGQPADPNRLYVVESSYTNTGASADHRLPLRPSQIEAFTARLAAQLGVNGAGAPQSNELDLPAGWLEGLASDLQSAGSNALVIAGRRQSPQVQAMVHAINQALGSVGVTVIHTEPVQAVPGNQTESLRQLAGELHGGGVELLVILGGNPAYTAPADLGFAEAIQQAGLSIYVGLFANETAALTHWDVPAAHYLEMWSDTRAYDGTVSIVQPLIEPLYAGRSPHEILAELMGDPEASGYDLVRGFYLEQMGGNETAFEAEWRLALHEGLLPGTALEARQVLVKGNIFRTQRAVDALTSGQKQETGGLEIVFEPDPSVWDGRYANNAWLQELPKPISKVTWDNYAQVSPATAARLELTNHQVVELHYNGRAVEAPVWIQPGQPDDTVTVYLGYGRRQGGRLLAATGFNAYALRTSDAPWSGAGLEVRPTQQTYNLASTQIHHYMEGRPLAVSGTVAEFMQDPEFLHLEEHGEGGVPSLYPEFPYNGHAWGMAINLSACTGCNACVVACQAENNIPVVGKDQVLNSREMHWMRIDAYFEGSLENAKVAFQPMLCQHCEKAPCEPVCPVAATVHSAEGLNEMVYNRCIGTRYCSNNCPYKVRRFNFLQYSEDTLSLQLLHNPEVTVRSRGVMEKCTYCVQRINQARITAKREGRPIQDGEVVTACQQACPANAIVFGDINNPESAVAHLREQPHNYEVLGHLGTQPRTTYLARLTNPNPQIEDM